MEPEISFVQRTGLLVGHVLATATNQHTQVRLLNLSNSDVKLYKSMHIGTFHSLQNYLQDKLKATCVSAMFPEDKDWRGNLLNSNNLTTQQNEEVLC